MYKTILFILTMLTLTVACSSAGTDQSNGNRNGSAIQDPGVEAQFVPRIDRGHARSNRALMSATTNAAPAPFFSYFGGPVADHLEISAIYWGDGVNFAGAPLDAFYGTVADSYPEGLQEYDTPTQKIASGHFCGSVTDSVAPPQLVTDDQVQAEIRSLIAAGRVPPADGNRLYVVHLPPGVTSQLEAFGQQLNSCEAFCAYHLAFPTDTGLAYYSVVPDQTDASCSICNDAPNAFDGFDVTTARISHQFAVVKTDPASALIPALASPTAWLSQTNGLEISDVCETSPQGDVGGYAVAAWYSDAASSCVVRRDLAADDYNVLPSLPRLTLHPGQSVTERVQLTVTNGHTIAPVRLSIAGLPAGVHATLSDSITASDDGVDLTVTVDADAPASARTPFTITAASATVTNYSEVFVRVVTP